MNGNASINQHIYSHWHHSGWLRYWTLMREVVVSSSVISKDFPNFLFLFVIY